MPTIINNTSKEELANDIYELSMRYMEDYGDQQMVAAMELDAYEKEHHHQQGEQEGNDDAEPTQDEFGQTLPVSDAHQGGENEQEEAEAESTFRTNQELNANNPRTPTDAEDQEEDEANLFDILNEDVSDIEDDALIDEEQVDDNAEEDE